LRFYPTSLPRINCACLNRVDPPSMPPRAVARSMGFPFAIPRRPRCTTPRSPRSA
jgi:hypothetical protein